MRVKVLGGTASSGEPSLCVTCRYSTMLTGARLRDERTYCSEIYGARRIPFPVLACSAYSDKRRPSVREMEGHRLDPAIRRKEEGHRVRSSAITQTARSVHAVRGMIRTGRAGRGCTRAALVRREIEC